MAKLLAEPALKPKALPPADGHHCSIGEFPKALDFDPCKTFERLTFAGGRLRWFTWCSAGLPGSRAPLVPSAWPSLVFQDYDPALSSRTL